MNGARTLDSGYASGVYQLQYKISTGSVTILYSELKILYLIQYIFINK